MRYVCPICGYVYDEAREGVPFADLPASWKCPVCNAAKAAFAPEAGRKRRPPLRPPPPLPLRKAMRLRSIKSCRLAR